MDKRIIAIIAVALVAITTFGIVGGALPIFKDQNVTSPEDVNIPEETHDDLRDQDPPAVEKAGTSIVLTPTSNSVKVGVSMHYAGALTAQKGVEGATVTISIVKPDGKADTATQGKTVTTDSAGKFSVDYKPTAAGTFTVKASYAGNDAYKGTAATTYFTAEKADEPDPVQCNMPWPSRINMIDTPSSMIAGQTYTFKCQLQVRTYDTFCKPSSWLPGVDAEITWTFTNSNGVSVSIESTSSLKEGIASIQFPCYMAGTWSVEAHFDGNAKYLAVDGHTSVKATGNTVYWHGFWVTVEKWYVTADTSKYPIDFNWMVNDPVFVLLKVKNAQDVINTNLYIPDLYVTDTDGQAYWGFQGRFMGTNDFTSGLAPGAEAKVWVCFQVPNSQSLVINGLSGVVHTTSDWYYQDYGYIAAKTYNVNIPLPAQSPA